ncbi:hypothetical protein BC833DRAFT_645640 [Globomyces pollinis-pini]|nr:hypothetical protein BC833DRAFT_645640 [Globomyces pollinis-pini]
MAFIPVNPDSDFPLNNIPFGIISTDADYIMSLFEAIKKSMWIKAEDFPPIPEYAWSPGISEQPKLRRYLDAWIDSVNDAE